MCPECQVKIPTSSVIIPVVKIPTSSIVKIPSSVGTTMMVASSARAVVAVAVPASTLPVTVLHRSGWDRTPVMEP